MGPDETVTDYVASLVNSNTGETVRIVHDSWEELRSIAAEMSFSPHNHTVGPGHLNLIKTDETVDIVKKQLEELENKIKDLQNQLKIMAQINNLKQVSEVTKKNKFIRRPIEYAYVYNKYDNEFKWVEVEYNPLFFDRYLLLERC